VGVRSCGPAFAKLANPGEVAAGGIAPPFCRAPGVVVENPAAILVGAETKPVGSAMAEEVGKLGDNRSCQQVDTLAPGVGLKVITRGIFDNLPDHGVLAKMVVEGIELLFGEGSALGEGLDDPSQEFAKFPERLPDATVITDQLQCTQFLDKARKPLAIVEAIDALQAIDAGFLEVMLAIAVNEFHPDWFHEIAWLAGSGTTLVRGTGLNVRVRL